MPGPRAFARIPDRQRSHSVDAGRERALRRHWPRHCGCLFTFSSFVAPPDEADLQDFLAEKRRSLSKHIRSRLVQSVTDGELPDRADCEALANLCLTFLSGLTFRILDGASPGLLFRSIGLFVNALGFRVRRTNLAKKARN